MNTTLAVTWAVKFTAILVSLLGIFSIYMFGFLSLTERTYHEAPMLAFTVFFVLLGLTLIWVAYDVLRNYSLRSIKSLSFLIIMIPFAQLTNCIAPIMQEYMASDNTGLFMLIGIAPLITMIVAFKILVFIIEKYSQVTQNT